MKSRSLVVLLVLAAPAVLHAQAKPKGALPAPPMSMKSSGSAKPLSNALYIKAAEEGAPASISAHASVARVDEKGRFTVIRQGTNGFTCIFGLPGDPEQKAVCGDVNATQFLADALTGKPRPTNKAPGIAYMAKGGSHYENAAGEAVMETTNKVVHEPPHWMLFWPVDKNSGLPTKSAPVYIMFPGTPYAHLMVYQDPATIVK